MVTSKRFGQEGMSDGTKTKRRDVKGKQETN